MSAESTPSRLRLWSALLLLGTFALGIAGGAGLCRWLMAPPGGQPSLPPPFAPAPLGELGLSPAQEQAARAIGERHRPELEAVVAATFPRVRAINEQMKHELRAILTLEQQRKLDQLDARRPPPPLGGPPGLPPPGMPPPGGPPGMPPPGMPPPLGGPPMPPPPGMPPPGMPPPRMPPPPPAH